MEDILYNAAVKYKELLDRGYHIVLGRKSRIYTLQLRFTMDSFFHLVGFQHLTDITYTSKNRERIYKDILNGKITYKLIRKSVFYEEYFIEERIRYMERLEEMLDSCRFHFLINHNEYIKYTRIYADYLCEYELPELKQEYLYFFTIKCKYSKIENEYRGCSFFKKHDIDYRRGTSETKLLLNEKITNIGKETENVKEIYRHPKYLD